MNTLILTILLLILGLTAQAKADDITNFDYTGDYAINFGSVSNQVYQANSSPIGVGGPASNDDNGYASQFRITAPTSISDIVVNATVFESNGVPGGAPTTFDYQIYYGSTTTFQNPAPVPNPSTLVATSKPLTFANANATDNGITVPLNADLQPGTYWLAEVGNGQATVDTTQSYIDPAGGNTVQTPEPEVWVSMGLCALFILWKGRRYVEGVV